MNFRLFFETLRSKRVSGTDLNENDTLILVIGTAGSGKTSFINTVAQRSNLRVDHNLSGGTTKVAPVRCSSTCATVSEATRIVLVDTPPYPDDEGEEQILGWVKDIKRAKVNGIIFLHPITANRGKPAEYCQKIKAMGGPHLGVAPIVLVTTFWRLQEHKAKYETRLRDVMKGWESAAMTGNKLSPMVYDETPDSAWRIVQAILKECGSDFDISHLTTT